MIMAGRRTWASDEEREGFQTDHLEDHETRIDALETAGGSGPSPGLVGDITGIDSGDTTAAGASGRYADAAHQHALPTPGTPTASAVGDTASAGTGTKVALDTHRHAREAFAAPGNSAPGDTATSGSATTVPRSDHKHGREAFGTAGDITSVDAGDSASAGSTGKVADAGHQHATTLTSGGGAVAQYFNAAAIAAAPLGTANSDVTSAVSVTVSVASVAHVTAAMDCQTTTTGSDEMIGELMVDSGAGYVAQVHQIQGSMRALGRHTEAGTWVVALAAGTHTFKLRARKASAVGVANIQGQTGLVGLVLPV